VSEISLIVLSTFVFQQVSVILFDSLDQSVASGYGVNGRLGILCFD